MSPSSADRCCFTPPTLAKRWRCKPATVISMIRRGELAAFRLGDGKKRPRFRISPEAVKAVETKKAEPLVPMPRRRTKRTAGVIEFF
jgi:hypothetical protein